MGKVRQLPVASRRQESVEVMRTPAFPLAAPLRTSLIQRISDFASARHADPKAPLPHDDLTRIRGIGPRLAERLNLLGVARFHQIAAMSALDVRRLSVILGLGRIISSQDWIGQAAVLRDEAPTTLVETDEPQPSVARPTHIAGGLLDALSRKVGIASSAGPDTKFDLDDEPERVTEQAAMPHSPETLSDFFAEDGVDDRFVVGDGPPPLPSELPQATLPDATERADEPEDDEHGLRMIAALTTMPSLEPDCAEIMMEAPDIMTEEADITIIERASVQFDDEEDAVQSEALRVSDLPLMRSSEDDSTQINAATRASYFDDLNEAVVEIVDVDGGDDVDDLLCPQNGASARRKFFRALTGNGG
jgi:predicted flap endonuclease-1-like 5' DNA nuclease